MGKRDTMTITLKPATEALLLEKAQQEGRDMDALLDTLILSAISASGETAEAAAPLLPPETLGEDPRLAILRQIDSQSRFMSPHSTGRDFLREGREGGMFGD